MAKKRKVIRSPKVANNLRVSLDMQTKPWSVIVDQSAQENELKRGPNIQVVKWYLVDNAAAGRFVRFRWGKKKPPRGTFGPFLIDECCGKRATMCDLYKDDSTSGTWDYELTIEFAGNRYSSKLVGAPLPAGTPNIKNN
jgi:hypothetical protein